jgi:hypothetical protein
VIPEKPPKVGSMGIAVVDSIYGCKIGAKRQFCTHIQLLPREIPMILKAKSEVLQVYPLQLLKMVPESEYDTL